MSDLTGVYYRVLVSTLTDRLRGRPVIIKLHGNNLPCLWLKSQPVVDRLGFRVVTGNCRPSACNTFSKTHTDVQRLNGHGAERQEREGWLHRRGAKVIQHRREIANCRRSVSNFHHSANTSGLVPGRRHHQHMGTNGRDTSNHYQKALFSRRIVSGLTHQDQGSGSKVCISMQYNTSPGPDPSCFDGLPSHTDPLISSPKFILLPVRQLSIIQIAFTADS